jgi:general secretion pathway protein L
MRSVDESDVTAVPGTAPSDANVAGVWTLAGNGLIIAEPDGPATILVPAEQVLLLAVDLPLASRAKRLEALPFAIEDRIADPIEAVHLAIGAEIAPKRYLVAVVRHDVMAAWIERAEAAGLGHAAMVPDALALPVPAEGGWSVDLDGNRAVVRAGDGTGFACAASMLRPVWEAAGRPPATAYGVPLPAEMMLGEAALEPEPLARRLLSPPLDLRQGAYARRRRASNVWRRLAWIVAIGAVAHTGIALADTVMLTVIANRRAAETRYLLAANAPGTPLAGDLVATAANALPKGSGVPQTFMPLLSRLSAALAPLGGISARAMAFQGNSLTLDIDGQPGLAARIREALAQARVAATVAESPDGSIRITASPA